MTIEVPLTQGYIALIDDEDAERVLAHKWHVKIVRWHLGDTIYAGTLLPRAAGRPRALAMHRLILGSAKGEDVDHINHDGLDNRRANLRCATRAQNLANRRPNRNCRFGFRGVSQVKGRFYGRLEFKGRQFYTKQCADAVAAARAWDELARQTWGEFAYQNFPDLSHVDAPSAVGSLTSTFAEGE